MASPPSAPITPDTAAKPLKPPKTPNRLQSHFVAFLGGLTVAGFYAGYRFKEDLGGKHNLVSRIRLSQLKIPQQGFAGAITKLQRSVDDGS